MKSLYLFILFVINISYLTAENKPASIPKYYDDFSEKVENLVVIHDPLNWLIRVLDHKSVRDLLSAENLPKSFQKKSPAPDLEKWIKSIEQQATWIPEQTVIGFDPSYVSNINCVVKAMLYGMYYKAGLELKLKKDSEELEDLTQKLLKNIKKIKIPEMHLWTRFRTPMSSNLAFSMAQFSISAMKGNLPYPLPIEMTANEISMEVKVSNYLPSLVIRSGIKQMQLDKLSEKEIQEIIDFVHQLSFKISLKKEQSVLWLQLTPIDRDESTNKLSKSPFPDMGRSESAFDIVSAQWNLEHLIQYVVEWEQIIKAQQKTKLGESLLEMDPKNELVLNAFLNLSEKLEPMGAKGKLHYWHDQTTHWLGEIEGFRKAPSLSSYNWPLSHLSQMHSYIADTSVDLAKQARISFIDLDTQFKQIDKFGSSSQDKNLEKFMGFYKEELSSFLENLIQESRTIFEAGYHYGFHNATSQSHLKAKSSDSKKSTDLKDLKIPNLLFLCKVKDEAKATEFLNKTYRKIEKMSWQYFLKEDEGPKLFEKNTISKRIVTNFRLDRFIDLVSNGETELKIEGDFDYHFFIHDHQLILSSSKTLTEDLLKVNKKQKKETLSEKCITKAQFVPSGFSDYLDFFVTVFDSQNSDSIQEEIEWFKKTLKLIDFIDISVEQDLNGYVRTHEGQINYPD